MERIAVVTGAAGSIGLGTVRKLLEQGRRVVMVDRDEAALTRAMENLPADRVMMVTADIATSDGPDVIHTRARVWGPVTILVNNAGISPKHDGLAADLLNMQDSEWEEVFRVNITAYMRLSRQIVPDMLQVGWGRIVNVSSRAGRSHANAASVAYMSSKAAVLGLSRSLASEFSSRGITANSVAPGLVLSAMTARVTPELLERIRERTPVGRPGTADELGAAIAFLTSEDAGFITGTCLDVNGGALMC